VTTERAHPLIVVPHGNGSPMRYLVGLFLLAWLGGWAVGFAGAVSALSSGRALGGGQAFSRLLARSLDPVWRLGDELGVSVVSPLRARVIGADAE
jgi:hypothetical protein